MHIKEREDICKEMAIASNISYEQILLQTFTCNEIPPIEINSIIQLYMSIIFVSIENI